MCGIIGFNWSDIFLAQNMMKTISHRGPDGEDYFTSKDITLGYNRLAIVDPKQELGIITNESESVLVLLNGEIYNFMDIRNHLIQSGHHFRTRSDAEVLVHIYEEYGLKGFSQLDGMFAFALYDQKQQTLYLVRDCLGIKNIYYFIKDTQIIFASEIKAIAVFLKEVGIFKENDSAYSDILTYGYLPSPSTPFDGVRCLEPGSFLRVTKSEIVQSKYVSLRKVKANYTPNNLLALIESATKKMAIAEVPVAMLLSGGIDSSLLVTLASKYNHNIKAFAIGSASGDNEFYYSRMIADKEHLDYEELNLDGYNTQLDASQIIYHQETYQDGGSVFPKWYLAQEIARQGYKVVIGGSGADELFCGYSRCDFRYSQLINGQEMDAGGYEYFINNVMKTRGDDWLYHRYLADKTWMDISAFFDVNFELPYYHNPRLDKTFMAHGIEYRVPYQDMQLVNYVLSIPIEMKLHNGDRKFILKHAASEILPAEIIHRSKQPLRFAPYAENPKNWLSFLYATWQEVFFSAANNRAA